MKVVSRGFNPNLGEEFMQRHGAGFVIAQRSPSQTSSANAVPEFDDPSAPETEEGATKAEAMRRFLARRKFQAGMVRTAASSPSPSNTPATTESTSDAKASS